MVDIDWKQSNILKIGNDLIYDITTDNIKNQREKIEPWLTAIFQSEHLSVLLGSGLTKAVSQIAQISAQDMSRIPFMFSGDKIEKNATQQAKTMGRQNANFEDDFRVALELYSGMLIYAPEKAEELKQEIDAKLKDFLKSILRTEKDFIESSTMIEALKYLKSFLFSFASRTATRDRLNVFTTNYDRFIEYACDKAGILILDRFIGKIEPVFRTNKLDLDYHYNPPGIRGEPRYVEGVIRYSKIHGSLDWRFSKNEIIKSLLPFGAGDDHPAVPIKPTSQAVIYPNSSKGVDTIFYPYSELMRDFSSAISQPNSAFITYGYGFGDSHINRVLEDMLSIPSTHIVIISYDKADGRIEEFVRKNNSSQFTLLVGEQLGRLEMLVDFYLPKAAIDRITERRQKIVEKRGYHQDQISESDHDEI